MFKRFYKSLFFSRRYYLLMVGVISLFVISYGVPAVFGFAKIALAALCLFSILDYVVLFSRNEPVSLHRILPDRFSNGDFNTVSLRISNNYSFVAKLHIIEELPYQLQMRDFALFVSLKPGESRVLAYRLRPTERGEYVFHDSNVFIKSPLGLVVRRKTIVLVTMVKSFPSYSLLKKYDIIARRSNVAEAGNKKMRKIGHSLEFEQIKDYVTGDDIRSINWKATARKAQLMVNTYTDEKSQQVYCIIDKSRVMKMPFDGLTLLNYAINASLLLASVSLVKRDRAGLVTFSDIVYNFLPAERKSNQMETVLNMLYNLQTGYPEADYEKLFIHVRTRITQRSLLVLFTNFESMSALQRQLPFIKAIARMHLLLIVFFENTGLKQLAGSTTHDVEQIYMKTIAEKFEYEKRLIVKELQIHGIAAILTTPQQVTVNTVNKYLELKSRQAI